MRCCDRFTTLLVHDGVPGLQIQYNGELHAYCQVYVLLSEDNGELNRDMASWLAHS